MVMMNDDEDDGVCDDGIGGDGDREYDYDEDHDHHDGEYKD